MPIKNIYLTIDDAPSKYTNKKIDFLLANFIPAIFFCRGEFIANNFDQVVYAIQKGFLIGNHSYSHPYFSKISLEQCFNEILETEKLISKCYNAAKITRLTKIIRLPFGDRGSKEQFIKIQNFLQKQKFVAINFGNKNLEKFIDVPWTWDPEDYKRKFIQNIRMYKNNLIDVWDTATEEEQILLLHDFDSNHHLFEVTMEFLLGKKVKFLDMV